MLPFPNPDRLPTSAEMNDAYRRLGLQQNVCDGERFIAWHVNVLYHSLGVPYLAVECEEWEPHRVRLNALMAWRSTPRPWRFSRVHPLDQWAHP